MNFTKNDLGPFAPFCGYALALAAAVYFIRKLLWRKDSIWQVPLDIIPEALKGVMTAVLAVSLVFLWLYAAPANMLLYLILALFFGLVSVAFFLFFHPFIRKHTYEKEIATGNRKTKKIFIVGGTELKQEAVSSMKENNVQSIQKLLKGAAYDPDELWTRDSVENVKTRITGAYLLIILSAWLAITTAALVVQVKLTNKPASSVISTGDSPGLNKGK